MCFVICVKVFLFFVALRYVCFVNFVKLCEVFDSRLLHFVCWYCVLLKFQTA